MHVVLGFRNSDGSTGFGRSAQPLGYLAKFAAGEWSSARVEAGAQLCWVIPCDGPDDSLALRDHLNSLGPDRAPDDAKRSSIPAGAVSRLAALASDNQKALLEGHYEGLLDQCWAIIQGTEIESPDLEDPFIAVPEIIPRGERPASRSWNGDTRWAHELVIFDLDGTLVDSSTLDQPRRRAQAGEPGAWDTVRARLDEVDELSAWGQIAAHEMPGRLGEHCHVALVSRAPRWYVSAIQRRFAIHADHVIAPSGTGKAQAFRGCLEHFDADPNQTWVFGDDSSDWKAADEVGAWHLGNPWTWDWNPNAAPDVAWFDPETVLAEERWQRLRYLGEQDDVTEATWHRGSLLPLGEDAWALGRYFKAWHPRHGDELSRAVLRGKTEQALQSPISDAFERFLLELKESVAVDLVGSVPPREGQIDRFALYRAMGCGLLGAVPCESIVEIQPVPTHYKTLNRDEKRALRAGRYQCQDTLSGATVLILDDVTTTGSTLGAMADALRGAGAQRVLRLAWAVTQN